MKIIFRSSVRDLTTLSFVPKTYRIHVSPWQPSSEEYNRAVLLDLQCDRLIELRRTEQVRNLVVSEIRRVELKANDLHRSQAEIKRYKKKESGRSKSKKY